MNIILLGAPGVGKGTQSEKLSEILNIPHISTGDIFRENIARKSELGVVADRYISKGLLVPDDVTLSVVKGRISKEDCLNGFILDGFPRTIVQAEALDAIMKELNKSIDFVINITVDEDVLIDRLTKRRVCPKCKLSYHLDFTPIINNECSKCGTQLIQREDDKLPVIKQRFASYHTQTEPLINYYSKKKVLKNVKSEFDIEDSLKNTLEAIGIIK